MAEKMTTLNIRMTSKEKLYLKDRALLANENLSSYARNILLSDDIHDVTQDDTNVLQEKDERIDDLKKQLEDYRSQIEQLHTIILVTQKDNKLLIEQNSKRWWQFWKW